jgi:hypothetical protein
MKNYYLKNRTGEIINQIKADNLEEAIELFSEIKNLDKKELLKIYNVEKNENRGINR